MMSAGERQKFILDELYAKTYVEVNQLSEQLNVTGATIRKDLSYLEDQKLLIRSHGVATLVRPVVFDECASEKAKKNSEEKAIIARKAASLIDTKDDILMSSGSTITAFARMLHPEEQINVVTPSLEVAFELMSRKNVKVTLLGGVVYDTSLSVRGPFTTDGLKNINCSKLFISCDGIDPENGISCACSEEAHLMQVMMSVSSKTIVLADSSKFGRRGFGKICNLEDVDILITDSGITPSFQDLLDKIGVYVIIAE